MKHGAVVLWSRTKHILRGIVRFLDGLEALVVGSMLVAWLLASIVAMVLTTHRYAAGFISGAPQRDPAQESRPVEHDADELRAAPRE